MSIGYMPKKRKKIRSERRRRKKYKHFSCMTCKNEVHEPENKKKTSKGIFKKLGLFK